jgi:hypothetical protein
MERDVVAKARARPSGGPAYAPGAIAQLEEEIVAKARSRPTSTGSPAAVTQMEEEVLAKARARPPQVASAPGAVAAMGQSQNGKSSGRSAQESNVARSAAASSRLHELEEDIMAKTRSRGGTAEAGAVDPAALKRNAAAAAGAGALAASSVAIASNGAAGSEPTALASMRDLEHDVIAKARGPNLSGLPSALQPTVEENVLSIPEVEETDALIHEETVADDSVDIMGPTVATTAVQAEQQPESAPPRQLPESPLYPGVAYSGVFPAEAAGASFEIEAFVRDDVVDAADVAVVMSEEEEAKIESQKMRRYICYGTVCLLIVVVAIVVSVVLSTGGSSAPVVAHPTEAPSLAPSRAPTTSPTSTRFIDALQVLETVTNKDVLENRMTPQFQGANWVTAGDPLRLPVSDPKFLTRYILAVFYFATGGDRWTFCGRHDPNCGGESTSRPWLTSADECDWLAVQCSNGKVNGIYFGELQNT